KAPKLPRSERAIALTTDGNARWCSLDPRRGAALLVAEAALNVACAGARPVALVNCLNFGNPEHPEVMWQLSESVDGMAEACRALGIPVVGGNVSLYNESRGRDIDPTPVVGLVTDDIVAGVHDVSDGGLAVTLAEMAVCGGTGFRVTGIEGHAGLFSEAPSRAVVSAPPEQASEVVRRAAATGVPATLLGGSGGDRLVVDGLL